MAVIDGFRQALSLRQGWFWAPIRYRRIAVNSLVERVFFRYVYLGFVLCLAVLVLLVLMAWALVLSALLPLPDPDSAEEVVGAALAPLFGLVLGSGLVLMAAKVGGGLYRHRDGRIVLHTGRHLRFVDPAVIEDVSVVGFGGVGYRLVISIRGERSEELTGLLGPFLRFRWPPQVLGEPEIDCEALSRRLKAQMWQYRGSP